MPNRCLSIILLKTHFFPLFTCHPLLKFPTPVFSPFTSVFISVEMRFMGLFFASWTTFQPGTPRSAAMGLKSQQDGGSGRSSGLEVMIARGIGGKVCGAGAPGERVKDPPGLDSGGRFGCGGVRGLRAEETGDGADEGAGG